MTFAKILLFALAATAALSACSSEPSDWRPDDKVSLDMIAPGTRPTGGFQQGKEESQANGAAIPHPINSDMNMDVPNPSAEEVISANAEQGTRRKGLMNDAGKASQEDTTTGGHEVQR